MRTKDNTLAIMIMGIAFSACLLFAAAKVDKGRIYFDEHSADIATTIGEIVGSVFGSLTLLILLTTYLSDVREKNFRQTLDLTERLLKVYSINYQQYESVGKNALVFGPDGLMSGDIYTYLKPTQPLFSVVMSYLDKGQFSEMQSQALVSILVTELKPMVEDMNNEIDRLGRDRSLVYNQIAQKQLIDLGKVQIKAGMQE